jgi:ribosomal protein S18 acetylase RimI-like enzyme
VRLETSASLGFVDGVDLDLGSITYRDATPADWAAIDAVFRQGFIDTFAHMYSPADLAAFFARFTAAAWRAELTDPDYGFRLAEADGALAGFAKISSVTIPAEPRGPALELRQIYLLGHWHGSGIAPALIAWAIDEARRRGAGELFLSVYAENHRALAFYRRYGFAQVGRFDFMVGAQADDERIMRLAL